MLSRFITAMLPSVARGYFPATTSASIISVLRNESSGYRDLFFKGGHNCPNHKVGLTICQEVDAPLD